jgi:hypothetical protein
MDYKFLAEREKAQEARAKQEQRAGVIDPLLNDANKQKRKDHRSLRSHLRNRPPTQATHARVVHSGLAYALRIAVGNGLSCVYNDKGDLTACS